MSTPYLVGALIGRSLVLLWILGIVLTIVFGYLMPLSIFLIARHMRKISAELARFNDMIATGSIALRYTPEPPPAVREHGARVPVGAGPLKL